jgi:hypothetical protein
VAAHVIHTYVTERPVEETVTLREEHVNVERHAVNRPASEADLNTFKEGTFEVTERARRRLSLSRPAWSRKLS